MLPSQPVTTLGGVKNACTALAIGFALLLAAERQLSADTITFDFESGPGPGFSTTNSGNLWTLDTDGPTFQASKPADDGSFEPNGFIAGGITSNFTMTGDFLVTVDFSILNFPAAGPAASALNESVLGVSGDTAGESFLVLRFRHGSSDQIEAFGSSGGPTGVQNSSLTSGQYQIERVGDTLTGRFAPTGSATFTTLGSFGGYTSPEFQIVLNGVQGTNAGGQPRSNTALDVAFDNLVVTADGFVGTVPEPSSLALGGGGILALFVWLRKRTR